MKRDKLYISRPALVTACGIGMESLWKHLSTADNSAIRPMRSTFGGREFYAATVDDGLLSPAPAPHDTHIMRLAQTALAELDPTLQRALSLYGNGCIGACVGGCDNGSELSIQAHKSYVESGRFPDGYRLEMQSAGGLASSLKSRYGLGGPATASATACSSSATATIKAAQLIRAGICDAMIVGGVDIVSDLELLGFDSMECISAGPSNPFSRNRSGITLGEAAVFFILSKAPISPEEPSITLAGYGETADAFHMTSPDTSAAGAVAAIRQALERAGIGAGQVDYVNLHGTGTLHGDAMEALAVSTVFGSGTPCSATKSITGHTLGAAGALALAICHETLLRNRAGTSCCLPAQAWDGIYDTEIPNIHIVGAGDASQVKRNVRYCMCNSFGFGGANVSLLLHLEEHDE